MAKYQFKDPSGKIHLFEGPPGLNQNDIDLFATNFFDLKPKAAPVEPPQPKPETGFIPSVVRSSRGIYSLFGDVAPAMLGKMVGADEYARRQMQEAAEYQKETQRLYPAEISSYKDIKDVGTALTYIKEAIAEAIPSIIPSIFTGGAAAIASRGAVAAAERAAATAATEFATKELVRKGGQAALTAEAVEATKQAAIKAGQDAAKRVAIQYEVGGALTGSAALNIPEVYQNVYEATGKQDLGAAIVAGSFNAVLDAITPINILRKADISGVKKNELIGAWYKRAGVGALKGFATEGATEAVQEMSSAAAEKFVDQNRNFFTKENFERFIDAGLKGGFGGAAITSAADVAFGRAETKPPPPATETETTTDLQKFPKRTRETPTPKLTPEQIVAKQAEFATIQAEIDALEAKGEQRTRGENFKLDRQKKKNAALKNEIDAATSTAIPQGAEDVAKFVEGANGEGIRILEEPPSVGGTEGLAGTQPGGLGGVGAGTSTAATGAGGAADTLTPPPGALTPPPPPGEGIKTETPPGAPTPPPPPALAPVFNRTEEQKKQDAAQADKAKGKAFRNEPLEFVPIMDDSGNYVVPLSVFGGINVDQEIPAHGQTLRRLIQRGGLSVKEAANIIKNNGSSQGFEEFRNKSSQELFNEFPQLFGAAAAPAPAPALAFAPAPALAPAPPTGALGAALQAIKSERDELNALFGGDGLPSAGTARRTDEQIKLDKRVDATAKRYGLTRNKGETSRELAVRINAAMDLEERVLAVPLSALEPTEIAEQQLKKETKYLPPQEQRDLYAETREEWNAAIEEERKEVYEAEYNRAIKEKLSEEDAKVRAKKATEGYEDEKLPLYEALSDDGRRVYFQNNINRNTIAEHDKAAVALSDYLAKKRAIGRKGLDESIVTAQENYMRERDAFGRKAGLSYAFPTWGSLSEESKRLFTQINKTDSVNEQFLAFRAVKKQVQKELAQKQSQEEASAEERTIKEQQIEQARREREAQPAGKGELLPEDIQKKLFDGDIEGVLDYLSTDAKGTLPKPKRETYFSALMSAYDRTLRKERKKVASEVFKNLAAKLSSVRSGPMREFALNVKVVYDPNMVFDEIGRYDADTNTIFIGPYGLDEATILHELTHAATVKIIHQFYLDPSKLDESTRRAVEHLINVAALAKSRIGTKYPNAFENMYEFIAYAMTDMDFQYELSRIQLEPAARATKKEVELSAAVRESRELGRFDYDVMFKTAWDYFTDTLAQLYKLFTPSKIRTPILVPIDVIDPKTGRVVVRTGVTKKTDEQRREEEAKLSAAKARKKAKARKEEKGEEVEDTLLPEKEEVEGRAPVEVIDPKTGLIVERYGKEKTDEAVTRAELEREFKPEEEAFDTTEAAADEKDFIDMRYRPTKEQIEKEKRLTSKGGVTNLKREILTEPGYKGNLLLETAAAFQFLLAAPEGNITRLAGKRGIGTGSMLAEISTALKIPLKNLERVLNEGHYILLGPDKLTPYKRFDVLSPEEYKKRVSEFGSDLGDAFTGADAITTLFNELPTNASLAATAPTTVQAPPVPSKKTEEELRGEVALKPRGAKVIIRNLFTKKGYNWLVSSFQNDRRIIKQLSERAELFKVLKSVGEGLNNVEDQLTRSTGMAVDLFNRHVRPLEKVLNEAVERYAEKVGLSVGDALANLHLILEARHEPERRAVLFMLKVPLDKQTEYKVPGFAEAMSPYTWREKILQIISESSGLPEQQRLARNKALRDLLNAFVFTKDANGNLVPNMKYMDKSIDAKLLAQKTDMNHADYNVIGNRSPAEIKQITDTFDKPELQNEINAVAKAVQDIHNKTIALNAASNYWSEPVQNVVDFYGYKNYIPFKGKPGRTQHDEVLSLDSKRIGGELQEAQNTAEGRQSESENPILQTLADGATAAMRAGRRDLTLSIKNAINDGIIKGEKVGTIKFSDRYLKGEKKEEFGGPDKIFHYLDNGTIEVYKINEKNQSEAIRRTWRESSPILDVINGFTSGIGQTHTRFNPGFAPMNFVRDTFTNAGVISAELGPVAAGRLIASVSADVSRGGLYRVGNFLRLYEQGDAKSLKEIERLAGGTKPYKNLSEKEKFYRDITEYIMLGGRVSYLQGLAAKGALDKLVKDVGRSGILKTKDQIFDFFDAYNDIFEIAARTSTYRVLRNEYIARGLSEEEASVKATNYAKNLANFEQVGKYGKTMGALFMFFRPAATGAVRAIDALAPAFGFNEAAFRAEAEAEGKAGIKGRTPQDIDNAVATLRERQRTAQITMLALAGIGVSAYMIAMMLSGDDDEGRNRVATDDMARWTRYARFPIPGTDKFFQIPWGFGPGAFAAAGAQIAGAVMGRTSLGDALSNIATIGLDSFVPIPFSRISPLDNFPAFAIDSFTPSIARPFVEYVMNLDGLGREIYNNRQSRFGDAYTGGDNIPEIYKKAARSLFDMTTGDVDISPNSLYFFASNYLDGWAKMLSTGFNVGALVMSDKQFDAKNDTLLLSSFVGGKSNVDAREFSKAENTIKGYERQINSLKDKPELLDRFMEKNGYKYELVRAYNHEINGPLRKVREAANIVRADPNLSMGERKAQLEEIVKIQNTIKRQILDMFQDIEKDASK